MGKKKSILGIFFTSTCPVCGKTIGYSEKGPCSLCKKELKYIRQGGCVKCGKPLLDMDKVFCTECRKRKFAFDRGISVFEHSGKIRKSIYDFKYKNKRNYGEFYADEAVRIYGRLIKSWDIDVIVPVPVHRKREIERGYNQAGVFAKEISKRLNIPLDDEVLIRKKKTTPQKELTEIVRRQNLKDAFAVNKSMISGRKNILVVDDIYTTGSTVDACSKILKCAGAKKVYFLCISSGVDR